ncbi:MAG TPA: citrate lyase acyl carrier protein [Eubacteriales bacterium]|nr:citrate lyase acyl carrier protein [Eubacteriales bacterium]
MLKTATAGTLESGDIMIEIIPNNGSGIDIRLDSIVSHQFGKQIKNVITQVLREYGVDGVTVNATDKGALDCTIVARTTVAVCRAKDCDTNWQEANK